MASLTGQPIIQFESNGDSTDELSIHLRCEKRRTHTVRGNVDPGADPIDALQPIQPGRPLGIAEEERKAIRDERMVSGQSCGLVMCSKRPQEKRHRHMLGVPHRRKFATIRPLVQRQPALEEGCRTIPGVRSVSIVGVPSSAGSYAAGQDQAPAALRAAGLIGALCAVGLDVHDDGDLPLQIWRPDRVSPRAQNVGQVAECVGNLIERLVPLLSNNQTLLVLGGNCTVALGVVAALRRVAAEPVGLLYVDRHYDINTPESTTDGALDWMGMAHALDLPGCLDALTDVLGPRPLIAPGHVAWLGVEDSPATEWERQEARRLELHVTSNDDLARDPTGSAVEALEHLPPGPLAVHIDVDVLDFTDSPLAENTDGRNNGPTLDQVAMALEVAARDDRFRALSIGELNPTRSAGDPDAIPRFIAAVAKIMTCAGFDKGTEGGA
jgi:arginase